MSNISRAYADALYEICIEENSLEEIMQQSAQLAEIMAANPEFVKLLNAPTVTKEEKTDLFSSGGGRRLRPENGGDRQDPGSFG